MGLRSHQKAHQNTLVILCWMCLYQRHYEQPLLYCIPVS